MRTFVRSAREILTIFAFVVLFSALFEPLGLSRWPEAIAVGFAAFRMNAFISGRRKRGES